MTSFNKINKKHMVCSSRFFRWLKNVLDQSEMFSATSPTPKVPLLLEGISEIMYTELNLDPVPCGGNALKRSLTPRESSCG